MQRHYWAKPHKMPSLMFGIIIVVVIVIVYVLLKESQHQDDNLPAVSEDVNLPVVNEVNPPMKNESRTKQP